MASKKTTNKSTTAKPTTNSATKNGMKAGWSDISAIRGKFDGVAKHVGTLPEGKQKVTIMNALETAYLGIAQCFQSVAGAPAEV